LKVSGNALLMGAAEELETRGSIKECGGMAFTASAITGFALVNHFWMTADLLASWLFKMKNASGAVGTNPIAIAIAFRLKKVTAGPM
jgi:hypothetical protein